MKITKLWKLIAEKEGLKKETNIAQIAEIIRVLRKIMKEKSKQDLYTMIRRWK
jgi:hypothetical protein